MSRALQIAGWRSGPRWTIGWFAWWILGFGPRLLGAEAIQPNILLILADDLGYGELGCYGGRLPTPQLDRLAAEGIRCTQGYVTAPFCAASRAALLTGRLQTRFGFEFNPIGAKNAEAGIGLPVEQTTLPMRLRQVGYVTGLVGKWHLGGTAPFHPQRRGFDEFFGFLHEGHYYAPPPWEGFTTWLRREALPQRAPAASRLGPDRWVSADGKVVWSTHLKHREPDYDADNPILRSSQPVGQVSDLTEAFTREAEAFIERYRQQPFLLMVSYNAVHSPLQVADKYLERVAAIDDIQRRIFAGMLCQLDDGVGRILDRLESCGIRQQTLVVFLSDNGGPTRELTSSNQPLRGEKGELREGGIRVPFLVADPGGMPVGAIEHRPVSALDIVATAMHFAGCPPDVTLDGQAWCDWLGEAQRPQEARDRFYWRVGRQAAYRRGDWKIYRGREANAPWELYQLAEDIGESVDLAARHPETLNELRQAWERLDAAMVGPRW
jgi:arylsulfatase B